MKDKHFVKDIFFSTTTLFNYLIIYQNTKRRDYGYSLDLLFTLAKLQTSYVYNKLLTLYKTQTYEYL